MVMVSRIREGSFDLWGKRLAGGDELLLFAMRPLIHRNGAFGLRGSESTEDPGGGDWVGEGATVILDPWGWPIDPGGCSHL